MPTMSKDWTGRGWADSSSGIEGRIDDAAGRLARSNIPFDYNLLDQAKITCPDSDKRMMDEYDRLLQAKLRQRPRGFWARLFGG
jgi:hypothetical protein